MKKEDEKKKKKKIKLPKWLNFILSKIWLIIGGFFVLLACACYIKSCSSKHSSNNSAASLTQQVQRASEYRQEGDTLDIFYQFPLQSVIQCSDYADNNTNKLVKGYLTVELTYEGTENGEDIYTFNKVIIQSVVTGDGLTQYTTSMTLEGLTLPVASTGYLVMQIYANPTPNNSSIWGSFASCEYDYVRLCLQSYRDGDSYLQNEIKRNLDSYDNFYDFLDEQCNLSPNEYDYRQYLFFYQIEYSRLIDMANAYNVGYMNGFLNGTSYVESHANDYDLHYDYELSQAYDRGFQDGMLEVNGNNIPAMIYTVFNAPMAILGGAFNFEIFGINVANVIRFLITVSVVIFIVKFFKGGK